VAGALGASGAGTEATLPVAFTSALGVDVLGVEVLGADALGVLSVVAAVELCVFAFALSLVEAEEDAGSRSMRLAALRDGEVFGATVDLAGFAGSGSGAVLFAGGCAAMAAASDCGEGVPLSGAGVLAGELLASATTAWRAVGAAVGESLTW
jgi:hypothetical protein